MPTDTGHTTAIRAKKVLGTVVRDAAGERLGVIEDVVLDKHSNNIMFAVVGLGGVFGLGEKFHPLPWPSLEFDSKTSGYTVPYTKAQLEAAPADTLDELTKDDGLAFRDRTYDYYQAERYWS
jgi:sporulation protein YlmC with PRC-barrel domain